MAENQAGLGEIDASTHEVYAALDPAIGKTLGRNINRAGYLLSLAGNTSSIIVPTIFRAVDASEAPTAIEEAITADLIPDELALEPEIVPTVVRRRHRKNAEIAVDGLQKAVSRRKRGKTAAA